MDQSKKWLEPYIGELKQIFETVEQAIAEFPISLRQRGLRYVRQFHPLMPDSTKNYICYLLPYWLQSWSGISLVQCRKLAVANVWVMLHYFLLDDAMDENPADRKARLALANLFSLAYMEEYRTLFAAEAAFWMQMNRYMTNWAEAVTQEDEADYFLNAPLKLAWKAAPVKLAAAGAFLLGRREDQLIKAEHSIDVVLATLQMSDDWVDWQEDLADGSYNSVLSLIRHKLEESPDQSITEAQCRYALYDMQLHKEFAEKAHAQERRMHELQPPSSALIAFHEHLVHGLTESSSRLTRETRLLAQGGFYHWMSK